MKGRDCAAVSLCLNNSCQTSPKPPALRMILRKAAEVKHIEASEQICLSRQYNVSSELE